MLLSLLLYALFLRILAVAWIGFLLYVAFLLIRNLLRPLLSKQRSSWSAVGIVGPAALFVTGSAPLWVGGAYLELACSRARSPVLNRVAASSEGLYWRARATDPSSGFGGFYRGRGNALHNAFAQAAIRALAEGRLGYLVIPYTVNQDQKLFIAKRGSSHECLGGEVSDAWGHLPSNLCVAWEHAASFTARFEVVGTLTERAAGLELAVRDRYAKTDIARFSYVERIQATDTLLRWFGIRSYQPRGCTSDVMNVSKLANLPLLAFTVADDPLHDVDGLATHVATEWQIRPH